MGSEWNFPRSIGDPPIYREMPLFFFSSVFDLLAIISECIPDVFYYQLYVRINISNTGS